MSESLTLYQIESHLLELMALRDSIDTDQSLTPAERTSCVVELDRELEEYVRAEITKVDGIASYIRECYARAEMIQLESKRLKSKAEAWDCKADRLKEMVIGIMQQAGKTHMEGRQSSFGIRKNPPSVQINQPEMVPDNYKRITVTMRPSLWNDLLLYLGKYPQLFVYGSELAQCKVSEPEPIKSQIASELKLGVGVAGCTLKTDSVRLEVK